MIDDETIPKDIMMAVCCWTIGGVVYDIYYRSITSNTVAPLCV